MEAYGKKLVFDYVNGNDIYGYNIDDLENNLDFMIDVIKFTKDKKMYELCSDSVKNDYVFVKFMIETFKDDISFVSSLALSYLEKTDEEDITYKEILVMVGDLVGDMDNLLTIRLKREIFATLELCSIQDALSDKNNCDLNKELGMGFIFIIDSYGSSNIIKNYFAKEFIDKIFFTEDITLEEFIHKHFKKFSLLEKQGINTFLINYIEMHDHYLAAHISKHIYLLDDLRQSIIKIGKNWNKYIERINIRRFNILNQEIYKYMDENGLIISFSIHDLLMYIMKNNNLEDLFNKYNPTEQGLINIATEIDANKMNLSELKFFKYVSDLVNELFSEDIINKKEIQNTKKTCNGYSKILKFNSNKNS